MFSVRDLSRPGLSPVSFDLARGECLAIQGASGSGKTLLLRAIADLDPNDGSITLNGVARGSIPAPQWRRRVAYVPAEPGRWADTVAAHFADWHDAEPLAGAIGLSPSCRDALLSTLSTGERIRLALVRTLVLDPAILLLDEPTGALDTETARAVETLIARRRSEGVGVLWVTHDSAQVRRVAGGWMAVENGIIGPVKR